jgi:hypothetical protein
MIKTCTNSSTCKSNNTINDILENLEVNRFNSAMDLEASNLDHPIKMTLHYNNQPLNKNVTVVFDVHFDYESAKL